MRNYMGLDGFIWFTGVVEDRNDPSKLGRVRVRCVGHHTDDKTKIPTADLPWAHIMHPVTDPSMNGMGNTPTFMVEGTWVVGFFMDAEDKQQPIIIGTLPGVPDEKPNTAKGFYDPNGVYPKTDFLEESDVNRLARGETENTIVETKNATRLKKIPISKETTVVTEWDEPESPYSTTYPKNHVFETESGHIVEYDDTENNERIHHYHKSGTFYEIDANGNKHEKIVGNRFEVVQGEDYHFAKDMNLTVLGTLNIKCKNFNIEVEEDYIDEVEGDRKSFIKGDVELHTQTKFDIFAKNTVNIDTASLDVDATTVIALTSDITTINGVTSANVRGATVNVEGTTSNIVGTTVSIDGTTVDIDGTTVNIDTGNYNLKATTSNLITVSAGAVVPHEIDPTVSISDITSPGTVVVTDPTEPELNAFILEEESDEERKTAINADGTDAGTFTQPDPQETGGSSINNSSHPDNVNRKANVTKPYALTGANCDRDTIGSVSASQESGPGGSRALGKSLTDGFAYGTYQISTKTGTFDDYLAMLESEPEYSSLATQINNIGGSSGASSGTTQFRQGWQALSDGPSGNLLRKSEHHFIKKWKYQPSIDNINADPKLAGLDVCDTTRFTNALSDVIWSTGVQHGEGAVANIVKRAIDRTGKTASTVGEKELIEAIYDERFTRPFLDENGNTVELDAFDRNGRFVGKVTKLHYFRSSKAITQYNIRNKRYVDERLSATTLYDTQAPDLLNIQRSGVQ